MRYLLAVAVLILAGCSDVTAPKATPDFLGVQNCSGPVSHNACTGGSDASKNAN